ncbi:hypothetical protein F5146DRAFT_1021977 [Armillaria mellea]|nr:hypothetical protein F5146DRAFT_1021977 [Armillaria mellea]
MLAQLSIGAKQVLELSSRLTGGSDDEDQPLVINLEVLLQDLALQVPDVWRRAATIYGESIHPACSNLRTMLSGDVERMEKFFLELETHDDDDGPLVSDLDPPCPMNLTPDASSSTSRSQQRRSRSVSQSASISFGSAFDMYQPSPPNFQVPEIVLTLCPSQPRDISCCVPIQDSAYNQRLTVPTHTTVNSVFPPMRARSPPVKSVKDWIWRDGHWQAILPDLDEQARRGIFSRPSSNGRRRVTRCCKPQRAFHPSCGYQRS